MFIHLFTVRVDAFEPPSIDNTDVLLMMDEQTYVAAKELSHVPKETERERNKISNYMFGAGVRMRFNPTMYQKILRLDSETELDRDTLENYIQSLPMDRLKAKLKSMEF